MMVRNFTVACVLFVFTSFSFAADDVFINKRIKIDHSISKIKQELNLSRDYTLTKLRVNEDRNKRRHTRYQLNYKNIPVFGKEIIVHENARGKVYRITGDAALNIEDDLSFWSFLFTLRPSVILTQALNASLSTFNIKAGVLNPLNTFTKKVIYIDHKKATLAYHVSFNNESKAFTGRPNFILSARRGKLIRFWDGLAHVEIGTGPGGNEKTGRYEYGIGFDYLDVTQNGEKCSLENNNVKTVNLQHFPFVFDPLGLLTPIFGLLLDPLAPRNAHSFNCPENTVKSINGAYSPLNDAHYFGNVVFAMFQEWYQRSPLATQLVLRVHYGLGYQNAFWNGREMTFGDGGSILYPLVSLDVTAHEVSHGFTEQNSNLVYSGHSGGINEAFSDIAGEAAEYYLLGENDFLVGADIFKSFGALRYMEAPSLDGNSINHANEYRQGMDVHFSSGVYNRAFYLLVNSPGWDVKKAFDVFVYANMNYWTPSITFNQGLCGLVSATQDLNYSARDVRAAFSHVGVSCS